MSKLSQNDLYVLARAFAKMPTDGLECSTAIRLVVDNIDFSSDDGYELARKMFAEYGAEIFAIDPKAAPPKPDDDDSLIYVPDLPEDRVINLKLTIQAPEHIEAQLSRLRADKQWLNAENRSLRAENDRLTALLFNLGIEDYDHLNLQRIAEMRAAIEGVRA